MNYLRKALALLVAVLLLMPAGLSMVSAATFSDVTAGTAMYEAVTNLANLGIIEGYPDNTFKPDNIITRAEFAAVITRFLNIDGAADESLPTGFPDVDDVNHWARNT